MKKSDLGIAKKYLYIQSKIYNALLRNLIEPQIEKIHRNYQNGFRRNRSTTPHILTTRRILEGVRTKKPRGNNSICRLLQSL